MKILKSFNSFISEKKTELWSPYEKADILAGDMFGEMGLFSLSDDQLDQIIDLKKADKLAKKRFGEFGFKTLAAKEMEELIDNNPKLLRESITNEGKTISFAKASMLGSKLLNKIKIGTILDTKGGQYEITDYGQQSNAFKEFEAEKDGKIVKVKLTAMYGLKLEVTDDVRSARFNKEEEINSIILESLITEAKVKVTKNEWPYLEFKVGGKKHKVDFDYEDIIDDHGNEGQDQYWLGKDDEGQEWMIDVYANYMGDVEEVHYDTIVKESVSSEFSPMGYAKRVVSGAIKIKDAMKEAGISLANMAKLIKRIDKSFEHRNKFHSYDFSYNKQIFSFGGYGLFDDNNLLTYFDDKTQEWHEFLYHRSGDEIPSKRKIPIGQVNDDVLFIGGGISKNVDSKLNISNNRLTDFWKLDLTSRSWEKLGDAKKTFLEINSFNETLTKIISFKGGSLIVNQDQVFWVDILNNSIWQFTHPSKEIMFGANTIIYNSKNDSFLVSTLNHNSGDEKLMTIKSIDLLGDKTIKNDLYKPTNQLILWINFSSPEL